MIFILSLCALVAVTSAGNYGYRPPPPICSGPSCGSGFSLNNKLKCECVRVDESSCQAGSSAIVDFFLGEGGRKCVCEATSEPTCTGAFSLNSKSCLCEKSVSPICPEYTYLESSGYCFGTKQPNCPYGSELEESSCQCVSITDRSCPGGGSLTPNGCSCIQVQTPSCSGVSTVPNIFTNCELSEKKCRCVYGYVNHGVY